MFATAYMTKLNDVTPSVAVKAPTLPSIPATNFNHDISCSHFLNKPSELHLTQPIDLKHQPSNGLSSYPAKTNTLKTHTVEQPPSVYQQLRNKVYQALRPESAFQNRNDYIAYVREEQNKALKNVLSNYNADFNTYCYAKAANKLATHNPTNLTNAYWQSIVKFNLSAHSIADAMDLTAQNAALHLTNNQLTNTQQEAHPTEAYEIARNPIWSMQRMGQSSTVLANGTEILIGGKYEDYYDSQFFIYNDVIVKHPDGRIEIFGYPSHVFPPTDFHSATLVGDEIWIIGSLGNQGKRLYSHTQVYMLNIHTFTITQAPTVNSMGWVHKHNAEYRDGQIIVKGGLVLRNQHLAEETALPLEDMLLQESSQPVKLTCPIELPPLEQIDTWTLNLTTLIWTNLSKHQWQSFMVWRTDFDELYLSDFDKLALYANQTDSLAYQQYFDELYDNLGMVPNMRLFKQVFIPPIEHTPSNVSNTPETYDTRSIFIHLDNTQAAIKVRYVNKGDYLQVIIEGILPDATLQLLQKHLCHQLYQLLNTPCDIIDIDY